MCWGTLFNVSTEDQNASLPIKLIFRNVTKILIFLSFTKKFISSTSLIAFSATYHNRVYRQRFVYKICLFMSLTFLFSDSKFLFFQIFFLNRFLTIFAKKFVRIKEEYVFPSCPHKW